MASNMEKGKAGIGFLVKTSMSKVRIRPIITHRYIEIMIKTL